ncbi:hypothetical protein DCAR_0521974 [Daucus carota subsp. sativus]|uniref:LysM domain-containing protein n=1 Tax=Daucus carota subsp. sativus TaxID=79200 RepID=A0AAF1B1I0_DAUCS|nr:hypothetical protein DCAR_0521974 [Daucus carota subsp. sativus]
MSKTTMTLLDLVRILPVLLLVVSMAEGGSIALGIGFPKSLVCTRVHGAESGDTCFSITTALNITPEFFSTINPNLNCSNIFVSEWLCINGTIS